MGQGISKKIVSKLVVLLPAAAGVCWGITGFFIRVLNEAGFDSPTIVFSRMSVGTVLSGLLLLIMDRKRFRINISDIPYMIAMSVVGCVMLMMAYNYSVNLLSLSLAAVLMGLAPVFVLIISAIVFKEKITVKKIVCMIAAFTGCAMLSGIFDGSGIRYDILGIIMGLATAICSSIYILSSRVVARRDYHPVTISFYTALISSISLIPFTDWGMISSFIASAPVKGTGFLIIQSVVTSLFPTILFVAAMKYLDAGKNAIIEAGAEPASALILGLIVYNEVPSLTGLIGMIMTVAAIMVLARDDN